jgi:hypothetical protein
LGIAAEDARSPVQAPHSFSGKVVIDAMSPLDFSGGFPPKLSITGEDSLGEHVRRALPDAKVVKAFDTIGNEYFVDPTFCEGQPTMLIAGDACAAPGTTASRYSLASQLHQAPVKATLRRYLRVAHTNSYRTSYRSTQPAQMSPLGFSRCGHPSRVPLTQGSGRAVG